MSRFTKFFRPLLGHKTEREGSVLVLAAICLVLVFGFTAFVVDIGYIAYSKAQLQNVTDAAVLSAALELDMMGDQGDVESNAIGAAMAVASTNPGGEITVQTDDEEQPFQTVQPIDIEFGRQVYNADTGRYQLYFGAGQTPYNVIKVTGKRTFRPGMGPEGGDLDARLPLFFAPVIGHDYAEIEVTSIATFQPRDVMLVLDLSGSMNDDSELKSINNLGRDAVESNLEQIYTEMTVAGAIGQEIGDHLAFTPAYVQSEGIPEDPGNDIPHIKVTWKGYSIDVESTMSLNRVKLQYTNGQTKTFSSLSGTTGSFSGSKEIRYCWIRSGQNRYVSDSSGNGEKFSFNNSDIQAALGLSGVSYPYNSGSWSDYFSYVKSSSNSPSSAGYRYMFGGMTLADYWLNRKTQNSQTGDLWRASAQPVTALKNAVGLFINYLQSVQAEDKVGLSVYNNQHQDALLEHELSNNLTQILTTTTYRQAGHYDSYTNIGAGMRIAREEMIANARPKAMRMMVLITDGIANRSSTGASPAQSAIDEAYAAKSAKIKIMTISLGANADTGLMQQIADITGGEHFNVPGGQTVAQYTQELQNHFNSIAADRPLKLIDEEYNGQ